MEIGFRAQGWARGLLSGVSWGKKRSGTQGILPNLM